MEKLKKVELFSELKIGMLVVVKDCLICRKARCRGILVRFGKAVFMINTNNRYDAFQRLPSCDEGKTWVTAHTIEQGRLYRVEDGLEDDSRTETRTKKTTARRSFLAGQEPR
jgi:hypothetical protein